MAYIINEITIHFLFLKFINLYLVFKNINSKINKIVIIVATWYLIDTNDIFTF